MNNLHAGLGNRCYCVKKKQKKTSESNYDLKSMICNILRNQDCSSVESVSHSLERDEKFIKQWVFFAKTFHSMKYSRKPSERLAEKQKKYNQRTA